MTHLPNIGNKSKNKQWDLIKLKSFCTKKGDYKQGEKRALGMGEIITNEATDKQLISKIYKQVLQLNSRKKNDPIKKWAK